MNEQLFYNRTYKFHHFLSTGLDKHYDKTLIFENQKTEKSSANHTLRIIMKRSLAYLLLGFAILITRLPFIFNSLGIDFDIWREVYSGKRIMENQIYEVSRFPGYPFSEFTFSLLYDLPYWCLNLVSVFFTIGSCIVFYEILLLSKVKNSYLLSASLAFIPIVYISSTIAIEYNWSLFFILLCTYTIFHKKLLLSSLFFGLIVCSRFSNVIFLGAYIFLIYVVNDKNSRITLKYLLGFLLFSLVFFLPVIIRYNGNFLYHYGSTDVSFFTLISLSTLYIFGIIGSIGLFLALLFNVIKNWKKIEISKILFLQHDILFIFSVLMCIINFVFFVKFPLEPGYLIPGIPFFILILSKILEDRSVRILAYSFILSPFFLYFSSKSVHWKGIVLINEDLENQQIAYSKSLLSAIEKLPEGSVIVVGEFYEQLSLMKKQESFKSPQILKYLKMKDIRGLQKDKIKIFYTEEANEISKAEYNIDIKAYGEMLGNKLQYNR